MHRIERTWVSTREPYTEASSPKRVTTAFAIFVGDSLDLDSRSKMATSMGDLVERLDWESSVSRTRIWRFSCVGDLRRYNPILGYPSQTHLHYPRSSYFHSCSELIGGVWNRTTPLIVGSSQECVSKRHTNANPL